MGCFLKVLMDRNTAFEALDLSSNTIGDVGLDALTNALNNNRRLKELNLNYYWWDNRYRMGDCLDFLIQCWRNWFWETITWLTRE
jgi:Ran GTPase-activating protein (RanGAP) involved in mRNA processing and transport